MDISEEPKHKIIAICFLCKNESEELKRNIEDLIERFSKSNMRNNYIHADFFIIDESEIKENSIYRNALWYTSINKSITSVDNFFYMCCEKKLPSEFNDYDYFWMIEEDVFVNSVDCIFELQKKIIFEKADLTTKAHSIVNEAAWLSIGESELQRPWFKTMACVTIFSKKMIQAVKDYAEKNKQLVNPELMLNTLAAQKGLRIYTPEELRAILWQGQWTIDDLMILKKGFVHPLKDISAHVRIRNGIEFLESINYKPINKLPQFLNKESNE